MSILIRLDRYNSQCKIAKFLCSLKILPRIDSLTRAAVFTQYTLLCIAIDSAISGARREVSSGEQPNEGHCVFDQENMRVQPGRYIFS